MGTPISRRPVQVLPPSVAERIAAGEVIERPASVVKELVENSIDAGATEISVFLEDGGKSLIEVLDNGHGMPPEDLTLCLQRHATSKLSSLEDLEKILTLGFRGEALPSVAAVSDLSLLSRAKGSDTAYEIRVDSLKSSKAEPATFGHFLGSPHGTRIQARGLFSQIPARLKFLKSQSAEVAQVREWLERLSLAHPEIGFRLVSDGRSVLTLRPQEETDRVQAILSDGENYPVITASNDLRNSGATAPDSLRSRGEGSLHVRVHWLQGLSSPQARKLVQIVNGRALRDRVLQQAVMNPFRQALLPGQFPAVALFIEIDPAQIDVNVHPTKTEVRFLDSGKVFRAVQNVVDAMIVKNGAPAFAAPRSDTPFSAPGRTWSATEPMNFQFQPQAAPTAEPTFSQPAETTTETQPLPAQATGPLAALQPFNYVGTLFNTYLFYDLGDELALVDQHAAHERIRYEKLRAQVLSADSKRVSPQALLIPEAVKFSAEARTTLESRLGWLAQMGFEVEIFGDDTALFRAIPAEWGSQELRIRLKNLLDRVLSAEADTQGDLRLDESLFEKLASEACHSAVRAGDRLTREEAASLVEQLSACEHPWNCPHGRPSVVKVPRAKFEEWFLRRV